MNWLVGTVVLVALFVGAEMWASANFMAGW